MVAVSGGGATCNCWKLRSTCSKVASYHSCVARSAASCCACAAVSACSWRARGEVLAVFLKECKKCVM